MTTGYRPHLDGLRGVAIGLVVLDHFAAHPPIGSGLIGVAVFFALSGYLITGLLLDEHAQHGRVDMLAFYARRCARLVPGLVLMVAVTAPLLAQEMPVRRSVIAALTYTSNYAKATGWIFSGPYLQTWSLAVEEHFYLLWCPVLIVAARRGGARSTLTAALAGVALSTFWRVVLVLLGASAPWVGRESLARGDGILLGCALAAAVRLGWRPSRLILPASLAGLVWLSFTALPGALGDNAKEVAVQASLMAFASAGLVAGVETCAIAQRVLSVRPLVWLGVVSYSVYLWHFPLLALLFGRVPTLAILAISMAAAVTSYYVVEAPVRATVRRRLAEHRPKLRLIAAPQLSA